MSSDTSPEPTLSLPDLYAEFETALHRYAVGLTRDPDRADDLLQETFIRAMIHLPLLSDLQVPQRRAWLYRTLRNLFFDQERARKRQEALAVQLIQQTDVMQSHPQLHKLSEVLEIIPQHYRELLVKRYLLGMTSQAIADELDIPAATVRSRFRLINKWLRKHHSEFI